MIPVAFDYYRAKSVDEALALLKEHDGAKLLAGGHSLIPLLKLRLGVFPALVDIGRIEELKGIRKDGDILRIGALTTHAMLEREPGLPAALSEVAGLIGDPAVRSRGTVGGSLAHADPAADLPIVLLALGTTLRVRGEAGERTLKAEDFFTGLFETALGEHELLSAVELPLVAGGSAYVKLADPASRYALVGCAAALRLEGGRVASARVAVGGLLPHARRLPGVEAAVMSTPADEHALGAAAEALREEIALEDVLDDLSGSAEYRLSMAAVMLRRALERALARA